MFPTSQRVQKVVSPGASKNTSRSLRHIADDPSLENLALFWPYKRTRRSAQNEDGGPKEAV